MIRTIPEYPGFSYAYLVIFINLITFVSLF